MTNGVPANKLEQSGATLKQSVARAVGWATATRFLAQLANWSMTLVTIHFLRPQDYGLMAVTMMITGFVSSLSTDGIVDAIIQDRTATDEDIRSVFGIVIVVNTCGIVLLNVLSYPAALFYGQPRLGSLLQVASLILIGVAAQAMPRAMLVKKLDLKGVSRVELIARVSGGGLSLFLAWIGFGVWALLAGPLWAAFARAIGFSISAKYFCWPRFRFKERIQLTRAAIIRTGEYFLWYLYANSDVFIISTILNQDIVGIYYVARNLAALPVQQFSMSVKPAAFPAFALVQDNRAEALRYLQKAMRLLALICFPVLFGLAATAPEMVAIVLGPNWGAAAVPVAILAVAMALHPVGAIIAPFLAGIGEFGASFRNTLFAAILFPAAFAIGSHWGLLGVCIASLIAYPIQLATLVRRAALVAKARVTSFLTPLVLPLVGSLLMYEVVEAVRELVGSMPVGIGVWKRLACLVATGVLTYSGFTLALMRPLLFELVHLAKR